MGTLDPRDHNIGPTGRKLLKAAQLLVAASPYDYYITSAYRPTETNSHHSGLTYAGSPTAAIDIGFKYGSSGYKTRARWLASRLYAASPLIVELIVTDVGSSNDQGGYYVKNTRRVGAYAAADHRNHIHLASSSALADKLIAKFTPTKPAPEPTPAPEPVPTPMPVPVPTPSPPLEDPTMALPEYLVKHNDRPEVYAVYGALVRHIGRAEYDYLLSKQVLKLETDNDAEANWLDATAKKLR